VEVLVAIPLNPAIMDNVFPNLYAMQTTLNVELNAVNKSLNIAISKLINVKTLQKIVLIILSLLINKEIGVKHVKLIDLQLVLEMLPSLNVFQMVSV